MTTHTRKGWTSRSWATIVDWAREEGWSYRMTDDDMLIIRRGTKRITVLFNSRGDVSSAVADLSNAAFRITGGKQGVIDVITGTRRSPS